MPDPFPISNLSSAFHISSPDSRSRIHGKMVLQSNIGVRRRLSENTKKESYSREDRVMPF